ncbi:MAG: hypothetical protein Q9212_005073, partial [Teloschistes hypoglaucus]
TYHLFSSHLDESHDLDIQLPVMPAPLTHGAYRPRIPAPLVMNGRYPEFPFPPPQASGYEPWTPRRNGPPSVTVEYPEIGSGPGSRRHASDPPSEPGSFISAMTDSKVGDADEEEEEEDWPPCGRTTTRQTTWFTPEEPVDRVQERRLHDTRASSEYQTAQQRWRLGFAHPHLRRIRVPWTGRGWHTPWPAFLVEAYVRGLWYLAGAVPRSWDEVTMLMVPPRRTIGERSSKPHIESYAKTQTGMEKTHRWTCIKVTSSPLDLRNLLLSSTFSEASSFIHIFRDTIESIASKSTAKTEAMAEEKKVVKVGVVDKFMNQLPGHDHPDSWPGFLKNIHIASAKSIEEFRATAQEADDQERKAQALKPRPWSEIEKESEAELNKHLRHFEKLNEWLATRQQAKEKRHGTVEEVEKAEAPDTEACAKLMQSAVMGYDTMRRREKGLKPRSEKEYGKPWDDLGVWTKQMVEQGEVEDRGESEKDNGQRSFYSSKATQSTLLRQAMAEDKKTANWDDPRLIVEEAIDSHEHWLWYFLAGDVIEAGDRHSLQEADDQRRKEKGLEPRFWAEVAEALQLQLFQEINRLEPHNGEDDIKQPGELKPRPIRDYQEYMLLKLLMLKDKQWRKEDGLEPRSWEEVRDAFYDDGDELLPDDSVWGPATGSS